MAWNVKLRRWEQSLCQADLGGRIDQGLHLTSRLGARSMILRSTIASFAALGLVAAGMPAYAQTATPSGGQMSYAPAPALLCGGGRGGDAYNFNKNITINKTNNFNLSKKIIINKPITINKNIEIKKFIDARKTVDIDKNIHIEKNIDASKKIIINKSIDASKYIVINKNFDVDISAQAFATASAQAQATTYVRGGGSSYVIVINRGGDFSQLAVETEAKTICVTQLTTVVKSIHAICIDARGREHPAVRMLGETWIDSSFDKELYRRLEGATLKVTIGDVVQSSQGLVGLFEKGAVLSCGRGEALRHYQDGFVKCAIAEKVPDCTERENMRRFGIGNLFYSYVERVCVPTSNIASDYLEGTAAGNSRELEIAGSFDGGVGYAP